jgi:hypothetical protein
MAFGAIQPIVPRIAAAVTRTNITHPGSLGLNVFPKTTTRSPHRKQPSCINLTFSFRKERVFRFLALETPYVKF